MQASGEEVNHAAETSRDQSQGRIPVSPDHSHQLFPGPLRAAAFIVKRGDRGVQGNHQVREPGVVLRHQSHRQASSVLSHDCLRRARAAVVDDDDFQTLPRVIHVLERSEAFGQCLWALAGGQGRPIPGSCMHPERGTRGSGA